MVLNSLLSKAQSLSKFDNISSIEDGINAPFDVFNLICNKLNLKNAALLMEDYDKKEFFPVIYRNLDRTSSTRLHITKNKMIDIIQKKQSINIKRYFSYSDSLSISDYGILNLSYEKTKIYLIFTVSEGNPKELINNSFIKDNINKLSKKVLSYNKNSELNRENEIPPLFLIKANNLISKNSTKNQSFYILSIDAKQSIKKIINIKGLNPIMNYKIESNLYDIFANNIEELGIISRISYGEYILLIKLNNSISPELIMNHFNTSLASEYNLNKKWQPLYTKYNKYFNNSGSIEKAITILISKYE